MRGCACVCVCVRPLPRRDVVSINNIPWQSAHHRAPVSHQPLCMCCRLSLCAHSDLHLARVLFAMCVLDVRTYPQPQLQQAVPVVPVLVWSHWRRWPQRCKQSLARPNRRRRCAMSWTCSPCCRCFKTKQCKHACFLCCRSRSAPHKASLSRCVAAGICCERGCWTSQHMSSPARVQVSSPEFQGALATLSAALQTNNFNSVFANFGLDPADGAEHMARGDGIAAFLHALEARARRKGTGTSRLVQ